MVKCPFCGTVYGFGACPTCVERRKNEERHREDIRLSEERNRLLNKQIRQQKEEGERQAREFERQNDLLEQEKLERENEIKQQQDSEAFDARVDELQQYAKERGLKPVMVRCDIPDVYNLMVDLFGNDFIYSGDEMDDIYEIIERLRDKCLLRFNKMIEALDADDRAIKTTDYGMCLTPSFILGTLKEVLNSHSSDYVVIPSEDKIITVFPLNTIDKDIKGYTGKKIEIGNFNYLLFLKNTDEINEVALMLSNSSKYFNNAMKKIRSAASEYMAKKPKSKFESETDFESEPEPDFEPKPVEVSKTTKSVVSLFTTIASIGTAFLAVILFKYIFIPNISTSIAIGCFLILLLISFFCFWHPIGKKIIESKESSLEIKNRKEKEKYDKEQEKEEETTNNAILKLKEQMKESIERHVNELEIN